MAFSLPDDLLDDLKCETENDILELDFLSGLLHDYDDTFEGAISGAPMDGVTVTTAMPMEYAPSMNKNDMDLMNFAPNMEPNAMEHPQGKEIKASYSGSGGFTQLNNAVLSEGSGDPTGEEGDTGGHQSLDAQKKRRSRNTGQMEMNRVAQKQYRARKKSEQSILQNAVDLLTAELAAMKVVELRAKEAEMRNMELLAANAQNQLKIQDMELHIAGQNQVIAAQQAQSQEQMVTLAKAQKMILDQHERIKLQEEIFASLRDKLKESVDTSWANMEHTDPNTVCKKMHEAVRAALMDAKDVGGLQEILANLPDQIVVEICKNILHSCKDMWPQVANFFSEACAGNTCAASQVTEWLTQQAKTSNISHLFSAVNQLGVLAFDDPTAFDDVDYNLEDVT
eukprot:gene24398-10002_t